MYKDMVNIKKDIYKDKSLENSKSIPTILQVVYS
jgi:hypothetical protein